MLKNILMTLAVGTGLFTSAVNAESKQTHIAGWIEHIKVGSSKVKIAAKLDTGAKTSSIHAKKVEKFTKNSQPWVKFRLPLESKPPMDFEVPVVREVLIKRHNLSSERRAVVKLPVCINGKSYAAEFTLSNRENYNYPVLLGRKFLKNKFVINPAKTFLLSNSSACDQAKS